MLTIRTEAIGILNPVDALRSLRRRGVDVDVVKNDVGRINHVDRPELRLHDVEIADVDIADVPENKGHWSAWTGGSYNSAFGLVSLVKVPDLAVAIYAAGAVAVDPDVVSCQDEAGGMVLEGDGVGVVAPVGEILGELVKALVGMSLLETKI